MRERGGFRGRRGTFLQLPASLTLRGRWVSSHPAPVMSHVSITHPPTHPLAPHSLKAGESRPFQTPSQMLEPPQRASQDACYTLGTCGSFETSLLGGHLLSSLNFGSLRNITGIILCLTISLAARDFSEGEESRLCTKSAWDLATGKLCPLSRWQRRTVVAKGVNRCCPLLSLMALESGTQ